MDEIPGCGGGGWTLAMKVNGSKVGNLIFNFRNSTRFLKGPCEVSHSSKIAPASNYRKATVVLTNVRSRYMILKIRVAILTKSVFY